MTGAIREVSSTPLYTSHIVGPTLGAAEEVSSAPLLSSSLYRRLSFISGRHTLQYAALPSLLQPVDYLLCHQVPAINNLMS